MDIKIPFPDGRIETFILMNMHPYSQEACSVQFYSPIVASSRQAINSKNTPKFNLMVVILTAHHLYLTEDPPKTIREKIAFDSIVEVDQV